MGKLAGSPPPPPDPVATGAAQTATNVETAQTTAALNRVNQVGPDGSVTYSQPDPNNPNHYTQTTSLSPQQQAIFDSTRAGQQTYAAAGARQIGQAAGVLGTNYVDPNAGAQTGATQAAQGALRTAQTAAGKPINTDYNSVRQGAIDAANSRLRPEQKMQEETLRSRLLNSGITEGSEAWNNAYRQFNNSNNDAQQQTILNAENLAGQSIGQTAALRQIPISEAGQVSNLAGNVSNLSGAGIQQSTAVRDQPLNETAALLNGSQVSAPQFGQVPGSPVAPTDLIGATLGAGGLANQTYAQKVAAASAGNAGMYALGGTAVSAGALAYAAPLLAASDERLKKDIRRVGETDEGTPIYTYKYKAGGPAQMGVMAQELMKSKPGAVGTMPTGFFGVDYAKVR